jgi:hypothetical protein
MTPLIRDPRFARRFFAITIPALAISAVTIGFVAARSEWSWTAFAIVVSSILLAIIGHQFLISRYRCPRCHARIQRNCLPSGDGQILFDCPSCDIEWDTGMKLSSKSLWKTPLRKE